MPARRLLIVLAVVGITACLVIADDLPDERNAIAKIELLGGKIERDENLPGRPVVGISLAESQRFKDQYIYLLKAFPKLVRLDLSGTKITDEGLKQLADLQSLVEINLYDTSTTRAAMSILRGTLPSVWIVDDWMISNLGGGFRRDSKGRIISVSFAGSSKVSDGDMRLLKPLKYIEILELQETRITDEGLKVLKDHGQLTAIRLKGTRITDSGLKEIAIHKNLRNLFLDYTQITDDGLVELVGLKNLIQLELAGTHITDRGLKTLSELKSLFGLNLDSTPISEAGLIELVNLPNLSNLNLSHTKMTDQGLNDLKQMKKLGVLNLRFTSVSDAGLKEIKDFKTLYSVFLGNTQVTDSGFQELKDSSLIRQVER